MQVQQLEQQLSDLESKHHNLSRSYNDLSCAHQKLKREVKLLRSNFEISHLMEEEAAADAGGSYFFDQFAPEELIESSRDVSK